MRIIDNYISSSIIKIFLATVFLFSFMYILIDITSTLDEIIDRQVPIGILIKYYLAFIPVILTQTSAFACLIAVLFTYSSLNNNNEMIALRACGLGFWRIARPVLIFGLTISAVILWLNESYVPRSNETIQKIRDENMILEVDRMIKRQEKIKNLTFYGLNNRLYHVGRYDPDIQRLDDITIIEFDQSANIEQKIVALSGEWTGIAWKFFQCQVTTFGEKGVTKTAKVRVYKDKLMDIKEKPEDFLKQRLNVSSMNIKELHEYIGRFSSSGAQRALNNLRVDYHQKMAFPIGNFVIILIGLQFSLMVKSRKGMTFVSIALAIGCAFLFFVINAVALATGKGGWLTPFLSAWTAPILFTGIALFVIENKIE